MPIYEYYCKDCDYLFEEWSKGYTEKETNCPLCGQTAKRLISNTSFVLKGSGFYATDYGRKSPNTEKGNGGNGKGETAQKTSQNAENNSSSEYSEQKTSQKSTSQESLSRKSEQKTSGKSEQKAANKE